jgi:hypothetical protein
LIQSHLDSQFNSKRELSDIIVKDVGLTDTITLLDERSIMIIDELDYYDSPISPSADRFHHYPIWTECVKIYSRSKPRF